MSVGTTLELLYSRDSTLQYNGCVNVINAALEKTNIGPFLRKDILEPIFELLGSEDDDLRSASLWALTNIAAHGICPYFLYIIPFDVPNISRDVIISNQHIAIVLKRLVKALNYPVERVSSHACEAVCWIGRAVSVREQLGKNGAIEALLNLLKHTENSIQRIKILDALSFLLKDEGNQKYFEKLKGPEEILRIIRKIGENIFEDRIVKNYQENNKHKLNIQLSTLECALVVIAYSLSGIESIKKRYCELGLADELASILSLPNQVKLSILALTATLNLSGIEEGMQQIVNKHLIDLVVSFLSDESVGHQCQALLILSNVALNTSSREKIRYLNWSEPLVKMLKSGSRASGRNALLAPAIRLIINISNDEYSRYILIRAGALEGVKIAQRRASRLRDNELQEHCEIAFGNLQVGVTSEVKTEVERVYCSPMFLMKRFKSLKQRPLDQPHPHQGNIKAMSVRSDAHLRDYPDNNSEEKPHRAASTPFTRPNSISSKNKRPLPITPASPPLEKKKSKEELSRDIKDKTKLGSISQALEILDDVLLENNYNSDIPPPYSTPRSYDGSPEKQSSITRNSTPTKTDEGESHKCSEEATSFIPLPLSINLIEEVVEKKIGEKNEEEHEDEMLRVALSVSDLIGFHNNVIQEEVKRKTEREREVERLGRNHPVQRRKSPDKESNSILFEQPNNNPMESTEKKEEETITKADKKTRGHPKEVSKRKSRAIKKKKSGERSRTKSKSRDSSSTAGGGNLNTNETTPSPSDPRNIELPVPNPTPWIVPTNTTQVVPIATVDNGNTLKSSSKSSSSKRRKERGGKSRHHHHHKSSSVRRTHSASHNHHNKKRKSRSVRPNMLQASGNGESSLLRGKGSKGRKQSSGKNSSRRPSRRVNGVNTSSSSTLRSGSRRKRKCKVEPSHHTNRHTKRSQERGNKIVVRGVAGTMEKRDDKKSVEGMGHGKEDQKNDIMVSEEKISENDSLSPPPSDIISQIAPVSASVSATFSAAADNYPNESPSSFSTAAPERILPSLEVNSLLFQSINRDPNKYLSSDSPQKITGKWWENDTKSSIETVETVETPTSKTDIGGSRDVNPGVDLASSHPRIPPKAVLSCSWEEYTEQDGRPYYYNPITDKTRWSIPKELMEYRSYQSFLIEQQEALKNMTFLDDSGTQSHITTPLSTTPTHSRHDSLNPDGDPSSSQFQHSHSGRNSEEEIESSSISISSSTSFNNFSFSSSESLSSIPIKVMPLRPKNNTDGKQTGQDTGNEETNEISASKFSVDVGGEQRERIVYRKENNGNKKLNSGTPPPRIENEERERRDKKRKQLKIKSEKKFRREEQRRQRQIEEENRERKKNEEKRKRKDSRKKKSSQRRRKFDAVL